MDEFKDEFKNDCKQDLLKAVLKRALGYTAVEEVEERDGEMAVVKQKTTKKVVAPCLAAAKLLIDRIPSDPYENMSDEELEQEKLRLLKILEKDKKIKGKKP